MTLDRPTQVGDLSARILEARVTVNPESGDSVTGKLLSVWHQIGPGGDPRTLIILEVSGKKFDLPSLPATTSVTILD